MPPRAAALLLGCAFSLASALTAAAQKSADLAPPAPHVRFFAEGSEAALVTAMEFFAYLRECQRRFPGQCGEAEAKRNGDPSLADIESLLDLGSLYAGAISRIPVSRFDTLGQWAVESQRLLKRLEQESDAYDRELVIREAAVLMACGENPESLKMVYFMYRLDMQRYHQPAASENEFVAAIEPMDAEARRKSQLIKSQWLPATCKKALALGRELIPAYYSRLRPLNKDDWRPLGKHEHRVLLAEHVFQIAFSLACAHEAAVCERIDAYNKAAAAKKTQD